MSEPPIFIMGTPLSEEFELNEFNPCVGNILLSESDRDRVWYIRLAPGERIGFHRHVLDYFWVALTPGRARSHINGAAPTEASYTAGQTQHMRFAEGEFMLHDLLNIGDTTLEFITVEHLQSANNPLPLPQAVTPQSIDATKAQL